MANLQLRTGRERTITFAGTFTAQAGADTGGAHPQWQAIESATGFTFFAGVSGYMQVWAGGRTNHPCDPPEPFPALHGWVLSGPPDNLLVFLVVVVDPNGNAVELHEPFPGARCTAYRSFPLTPNIRVDVAGSFAVSMEVEEWLDASIDRTTPREQSPIAPGQSGLPSDIDGVGFTEGLYVLGPKPGGQYTCNITIAGGVSGSTIGTYTGPAGGDMALARGVVYPAGIARRSDAQWGNAPHRQGTLHATMFGRPLDFSAIGTANRFRPSAQDSAWLDGWSDGNLQWAVGPLEFDNYTLGMSGVCYAEPITPLDWDFRVVRGWQDSYPGTVRIRWHQGANLDAPNGAYRAQFDRQYTTTRLSSADQPAWFVCANGVRTFLGVNGVEVRDLAWRFSLLNTWLNSDRETGFREDNRDWRMLIDDVFTAHPVRLVIPSAYTLDPMSSTAGWTPSGCTISIEGGAIKVVPSVDGASITKDFGPDTSIGAYRLMTLEARGAGGRFTFSVNGRGFTERTASGEFTRHDFDICAPSSAAMSDTTDHAMADAATYQGPVYVRGVTIGGLRVGHTYWFRNLGFRVAHRWGFTPTPTFREYYDWTDASAVKWRWWRGLFGEADGRRVCEAPFRRRRLSPAGTDAMLSVSEALALLPSSVTVAANAKPDTSDRTAFLYGELELIEAWFVADTIYQPDGSRLTLDRSRYVETTGLPVRLRFDTFWAYSGFGNGSGPSTWDAIPYRITKRLRLPVEGLVVDPVNNRWVVGSPVGFLRNGVLLETVQTDEVGFYRTTPALFRTSAQAAVTLAVQNSVAGTVNLPDGVPAGAYNDPSVESVGGWHVNRKARRCILRGEGPPPSDVTRVVESSRERGIYVLGGETVTTHDVTTDSLRQVGVSPQGSVRAIRLHRNVLLALAADESGWVLASSEDYGDTWRLDVAFSAQSALVESIEQAGLIVLLYENGGQVQVRRSIDGGASFSPPTGVTAGGSPLTGTLQSVTYHPMTAQLMITIGQSGNVRLLQSEDYGSTFTEVL